MTLMILAASLALHAQGCPPKAPADWQTRPHPLLWDAFAAKCSVPEPKSAQPTIEQLRYSDTSLLCELQRFWLDVTVRGVQFADSGERIGFGDLFARLLQAQHVGDAMRVQELLDAFVIATPRPSTWSPRALLTEILMDSALVNGKWKPQKEDTPNDGIAMGPKQQGKIGKPSISLGPVDDKGTVFSAATFIRAKLATIKVNERNVEALAKSMKTYVGTDCEHAWVIDRGTDTLLTCDELAATHYESFKVHVRTDPDWLVRDFEYDFTSVDASSKETGIVITKYWTSPTTYPGANHLDWQWGVDVYIPLSTRAGVLVGTLMLSSIDLNYSVSVTGNAHADAGDHFQALNFGQGNAKLLSEREEQLRPAAKEAAAPKSR
jgi:hypothetical protein